MARTWKHKLYWPRIKLSQTDRKANVDSSDSISLRYLVRASGFTWRSSMPILPVRSYATKLMITEVVTLVEMRMFSDVWSGCPVQHLLLYHSNSYQNMPLSNGVVHFMVLCWSFWCQPILKLPSTPPSCCHTHLYLISLLCLSKTRGCPYLHVIHQGWSNTSRRMISVGLQWREQEDQFFKSVFLP